MDRCTMATGDVVHPGEAGLEYPVSSKRWPISSIFIGPDIHVGQVVTRIMTVFYIVQLDALTRCNSPYRNSHEDREKFVSAFKLSDNPY